MNPFNNPTAFILVVLGLFAVAGLVYGIILIRSRPKHGFFDPPTDKTSAIISRPPVRPKRPGDPQNTLQQDLLLLAKHHYQTEFDITHAARQVCAYHVLMPPELMSIKDTNFWMFKEFVETGIILKGREKTTQFFLNLGGFFNWLTVEGATSQVEYHHNLLRGLLSELSTIQVYESGKPLLPFIVPHPDPLVIDLLQPKVTAEA